MNDAKAQLAEDNYDGYLSLRDELKLTQGWRRSRLE